MRCPRVADSAAQSSACRHTIRSAVAYPVGEYVLVGKDKYQIVRHIETPTGPAGRTLCGRDIPAEAQHSKRRMQLAARSGDCKACIAIADDKGFEKGFARS